MNLHRLRYFVIAAEGSNFPRASLQPGANPSAICSRLRQLATARKGMAISRGHKLRLTTLSCLPNSLLTKRDVLLVHSPGLREI